MSMKGTVPNGYDPNKTPALLLSLNQNGIVRFGRLKLEKASASTP